jgi:hypothetical protein
MTRGADSNWSVILFTPSLVLSNVLALPIPQHGLITVASSRVIPTACCCLPRDEQGARMWPESIRQATLICHFGRMMYMYIVFHDQAVVGKVAAVKKAAAAQSAKAAPARTLAHPVPVCSPKAVADETSTTTLLSAVSPCCCQAWAAKAQ